MTSATRVRLPDGTEVACADEGTGTPLLLVHGITEDRHAWAPFVPELARRHRVVRVDLPGHGESSPLPRYSAGALVGAVAGVVAALELERPHVVGHSLGGLLVTLLPSAVPVRSVVNVDQLLQLGGFVDFVRGIADGLRGDDFAATMQGAMASLAGPSITPELAAELRRYRVPARQPVVTDLWLPLLDQREDEVLASFAPALAAVRVPYLALHGEPVPADYARWLGDTIPGAHVEVWPGLGHWLHRLEPRRFVERLARFHAAANG